MNAEIISVGTELLLGQIVNSNARFLSQRLAEIGINVYFHTAVGDNPKRLEDVIRTAQKRSDLLIFTGGLGPTKDDLTKETIAHIVGKSLRADAASLQKIERYYQQRQIPMTANNRKQADVIEGSRVFPNDVGMAPGMAVSAGKHVYMLFPGPPRELKPMVERYAIPYLSSLLPEKRVVHSRVLRFFGIGESALEERVMDVIEGQTNPTVAPLAQDGEATLRLTTRAASEAEAEAMMDEMENRIRERVGCYLYGYDRDRLENVIVSKLLQEKQTLSVAESCSGGLLSHLLTSVSGASQTFRGGVVCYTNEIKREAVGVNADVLERYGAVSEETAKALAEGVRRRFQTDWGLSVTGVAGPSPLENKPVGLVYVGLSGITKETVAKEYRFSGSREAIKMRAAKSALYELWQHQKER